MIDFQAYGQGEHRLKCDHCGENKRNKTLGLTVKPDGTALAHCFRCNYTELFRTDRGASSYRAPAIIAAQKPLAQKHESLSDWGMALWRSCSTLEGVAVDYLKSRRCYIPPLDGDLRWHPSIKHPSGYVGAALVALISDTLTGKPLSLHRTWITAHGKANLETPRLPLAGHSIRGGCIRLWPDEYVTHGLAVGEGVETCLSLAHAYEPVWATIDAGHLAKFPVIPGIEVLLIARDNDPAGIDASKACAARWVEAGREVRITNQTENDINDVVAA